MAMSCSFLLMLEHVALSSVRIFTLNMCGLFKWRFYRQIVLFLQELYRQGYHHVDTFGNLQRGSGLI